jgi:hypothetical protein
MTYTPLSDIIIVAICGACLLFAAFVWPEIVDWFKQEADID